jgi:uncharacterized protein (TIGR03435 family)
MRITHSGSVVVAAAVVAASMLVAPGSGASRAQERHLRVAPADTDAFDEASVSAGRGTGPAQDRYHYGHWELTRMTLRELIRAAFALEGVLTDAQVIGGPEWARTARFTVHAMMPAAAAARPDAAGLRALMLQRLLAQRFSLAVWRGTAELPVYDLVRVDAGAVGSRLVPQACLERHATDAETLPRPRQCPPGRFAADVPLAQDVSMADLAAALSSIPGVDRVVRDRTGLEGRFAFQLLWAGGSLAGSPAEGLHHAPGTVAAQLALETALRAQLGLALVEGLGRVNTVRIARAELPVED